MAEHDTPTLQSLHIELQDQRSKLAEHITDTTRRFQAGERHFETLIKCMDENTCAIKTLVENTDGVVSAYKDVQAAARVGNGVLRISTTLIKCGGILAFLGFAIERAITYLEHWK